VVRSVQITPGTTVRISAAPEDAFASDRQAVLVDTVLRPGADVAAPRVAAVIEAAGGESGWIAVVRPGPDAPRLVVARLTPVGRAAGAAALSLGADPPSPSALEALVRRAGIEPDPGETASLFDPPASSLRPLPEVATETPSAEADAPWSKWWFWALAGAVALGAAAGGVAVASGGGPEGVVDLRVEYR
jgi:hypothetical protein